MSSGVDAPRRPVQPVGVEREPDLPLLRCPIFPSIGHCPSPPASQASRSSSSQRCERLSLSASASCPEAEDSRRKRAR
eukprot:1253378-Rhodomonas_salina.2